jgi:hypothetical protein
VLACAISLNEIIKIRKTFKKETGLNPTKIKSQKD